MRDFTIEGNDVTGYVGVSPEYMNYSTDKDRAILTKSDMAALVATGNYEFEDVVVPADEVPVGAIVVDGVPDNDKEETSVEVTPVTEASNAEVKVTF